MNDAAYELKFLLDERQAREVEDWSRRFLTPDPHGDSSGTYFTTSLYFDTEERDIYRQSNPYFRRRKFRVRRYGSDPVVYLERKTKWGDRVAKRRLSITLAELPYLAQPLSPQTWTGHEYHRRLRENRLLPACEIAYQRTAFMGSSSESSLRLTLDRSIFGCVTRTITLDPVKNGVQVLRDKVILELKFRNVLPALFKGLVRDLSLAASTVSKYRLCCQAHDLPTTRAANV
jgi:hypothetical protein